MTIHVFIMGHDAFPSSFGYIFVDTGTKGSKMDFNKGSEERPCQANPKTHLIGLNGVPNRLRSIQSVLVVQRRRIKKRMSIEELIDHYKFFNDGNKCRKLKYIEFHFMDDAEGTFRNRFFH